MAGILGNLTEMDTSIAPFEAGLAPFINTDKGDFIGRAALDGKDQRSLLHGVTCQSETPSSGSVILAEGRTTDHVTVGIPSTTLGCGVGNARFNAPGDWVGLSLELEFPDGTAHPCAIVNVPFFDQEMNIAQGVVWIQPRSRVIARPEAIEGMKR